MESPQQETQQRDVEAVIETALSHMGFSSTRVKSALTNGTQYQTLLVHIEAGDDGRRLIGPSGSTLAALQHLVRCVVRKQLDVTFRVDIDVNDYRNRREQNLAGLAESVAARAARQGRTIVMRPMQAMDRRLIHTALAERADVKTESLGEEPNRRVVVKPVFM